jgi:hypothetical protein
VTLSLKGLGGWLPYEEPLLDYSLMGKEQLSISISHPLTYKNFHHNTPPLSNFLNGESGPTYLGIDNLVPDLWEE